nr:immunoglobulin heavy chain junction region [Macaca mulatta]MOV88228.1 immunoglobulin heavy chain junction region [Macaca mulatta]MOV88257.1 immunoglobulin heavy chain junction region [Macaca mulatta]MOV88469.1 immunoglobulin heavy chain junction region [Macaca mulatta]MOV88541.1 immunoglobulin heavy chain junction region [Macaca mulatta]
CAKMEEGGSSLDVW